MSTREIDTSPSDLIAFKWANTLSQGEQDVLLTSGIRRLQNAINSALTKAIADERATPIPMVLHCPNCHEQHVDQPESERLYHRRLSNAMPAEVRPRWTNPPHKSHLCHNCGTVWRPADVATTGVESVQTRGKADTWPTIRRDDTADTEGEG